MLQNISISLNPSYLCNFRCSFCYLTKEQLSSKMRVSLERVESLFSYISNYRNIKTVDLYGGEPLLLPREYLLGLKSIFQRYNVENVNLITNLSLDHPILEDDYFHISVSYDFEAREKSDVVFNNMLMLTRPFNILMVASPDLVNNNITEILGSLSILNNLTSIEVKPYSKNQSNDLDVSNEQYVEFVKSLIDLSEVYNIDVVNESKISDCLSGTSSSYSDDHLYITPEGKLAVLDFDENDREYFLKLDTFEDYLKWCDDEKERVKNSACSECKYMGSCLSEHMRPPIDFSSECSGFRSLLDWY